MSRIPSLNLVLLPGEWLHRLKRLFHIKIFCISRMQSLGMSYTSTTSQKTRISSIDNRIYLERRYISLPHRYFLSYGLVDSFNLFNSLDDIGLVFVPIL